MILNSPGGNTLQWAWDEVLCSWHHLFEKLFQRSSKACVSLVSVDVFREKASPNCQQW